MFAIGSWFSLSTFMLFQRKTEQPGSLSKGFSHQPGSLALIYVWNILLITYAYFIYFVPCFQRVVTSLNHIINYYVICISFSFTESSEI